MLGVLMCYLMLQMVLLEGLWSKKESKEAKPRPQKARRCDSEFHQRAC
ncbi:MAG: hypothetical protein IJP35_00815 [Clostridia bacterium]|nr:hypothetical protein [Clostridia bacterium]